MADSAEVLLCPKSRSCMSCRCRASCSRLRAWASAAMSGGITANTLSSMSSRTLRRKSEGRVWMKVTGSIGVSELAFCASSRRCCSALCCASTYGAEEVSRGILMAWQPAPTSFLLTYFLLDGWRQGGQELRAHFGHTRIPYHCRSWAICWGGSPGWWTDAQLVLQDFPADVIRQSSQKRGIYTFGETDTWGEMQDVKGLTPLLMPKKERIPWPCLRKPALSVLTAHKGHRTEKA